jgi:hypothetical protein
MAVQRSRLNRRPGSSAFGMCAGIKGVISSIRRVMAIANTPSLRKIRRSRVADPSIHGSSIAGMHTLSSFLVYTQANLLKT